MSNFETNCVLDTGAGVSLIDLGSLEETGLEKNIRKLRENGDGFINASGKEMDIIGVVDIPVTLRNNKSITQEFKVLNSKSYSIILLGRDFMKKNIRQLSLILKKVKCNLEVRG